MTTLGDAREITDRLLSNFLWIIYHMVKQMVDISLDCLVFLVGGSPKKFNILHHVAELGNGDSLQYRE